MKTAKAWGLTPSQWDRLPDSDKARMMAYEETTATMSAYEQQVSEDRQKNQAAA